MPDKLRKRRDRLAQAAAGTERASGGEVAKAKKRGGKKRVSRKAKTQFTSQFATLQDAGLPVLRSLKVLRGQMPDGALKETLEEVSEEVETGSSLSDAFSKHPGIFDDLYVNMVRAGEASGSLTIIFRRLSEFMEKADALRQRVKGAMVYPVIVSIVAVAILTFIMLYVVPKFEEAFQNIGGGQELPGMTQSLISVSSWLGSNWWVLFIVGILGYFGFNAAVKTPGGRRIWDRFKLKLWVFGPIVEAGLVARFSRTLGTLSSSGVALMQSLEIVGDAADNALMKDAVEDVRDAVREGENMARPMAETGMFDDLVVNMVDVGEETGELDRMLMKIADNNEQEVDQRVGAMVQILEPLLIVIMAAIVGFIVIALFLPLLSLQESLAG